MFNFMHKMKKGEHVVIVCTGDSITEVNDSTHNHLNYVGLLGLELLEKFGRVFTIVNTGISGGTADNLAARLDRDVLRYKPDFITIMIGINDSTLGKENLQNFKENLKNIILKILNTGSEVMLLTQNPISYEIEDNRKRRKDYPEYIDVIRQIACDMNVSLCDIYAIWENMISKGDLNTSTYTYWRLMDDHLHPNQFGHREISNSIIKHLLAK